MEKIRRHHAAIQVRLRHMLERIEALGPKPTPEQRRHIRIEESLILPIFALRAERIEGGGPELFLAEHRKIEQFLADMDARLRSLSLDPRAALELIEFEWLFKQLIDHHDTRERNVLHPELHRVTTSAERDELRSRIDGFS